MRKRHGVLLAGTAILFGATGGCEAPLEAPTCPTPIGNTTSTSTTGGSGGSEGGAGPGGSGQGGAFDPGGGETNGSGDNTFDHMNENPFEILKERSEEGPPEIRTRLHTCGKIRYDAIGRLLTSRGVNLGATATPPSAGQLYTSGADSLGAPRYDAKQPESYYLSTSGATRLFDIFVQAAPEIIQNIQNQPACQIDGVGFPMFDPTTGDCISQSLTCLMGRPATEDDMTLCRSLLDQAAPGNAADLFNKQKIAVAVFLSAANTCD